MVLKKLLSSTAIIVSTALLASCGGGSGGSSVPPPPPPPPDTSAPVVSFSPTSLTVVSTATGSSTLTATDNVRVTTGPTVTCTNGGSFAGGTFTAPAVTVNTTSVCTATAGDAAGNEGTATLTVTVTPDTTAPTVSFAPTTLTVASGATGAATLTASDDVDGALTPSVNCTNGGGFTGNVFTAPAVTVDTTSVCTATATDAAGNSNTATLTVTITAPLPDTTAPVVTFSPTTLSVASGSTAVSTLTATDNIAITTGPTVSCTNGGSFNVSNNTFTAPTVTANTTSVCTATASDAAGNTNTATLTVTMTPAPTAVTISGKATYDFVPHTASNGLDYDNTSQRPIKGTIVEALDNAGTILVSGVTDINGDYSLTVDPNTPVRIRIKAQMIQTTGAQWNVRVQDNTSSDALYAIQSVLADSGTVNSTRDLNAASGWTGSNSAGSYTATRAAAPFAIIDPIYDGIQKIVAIDPAVNFPLAKFNWSTRNRPASGNLADGDIQTSFYGGNGNLYILGADGTDTDEYDDHVNVHEWGHYFEDQLSRSDSIGGNHGGGDRLDPRVAFGEGFGNALSGMVTDDPFYRDSGGPRQGSGFAINVEDNRTTLANKGWFSETSVQAILYDIYDPANEAGDGIAAGLAPIYQTLVSSDYRNHALFTTIFTFSEEIANFVTVDEKSFITNLEEQQDILGVNANGDGDVNDGGVASALPVYKEVTVNGPAVEICSVDDRGLANKLGNRAYVKFDVVSAGNHTMTMTRVSGDTGRDPNFEGFRQGVIVIQATGGPIDSDSDTRNLQVGGHVIDAFDARNVPGGLSGDACYNFAVTR